MTEASGVVNDPDGTTPPSGAMPGGEAAGRSRPLDSPSRDFAMGLSERLREAAVKAPLQSLFVAFLLGVWVARRR